MMYGVVSYITECEDYKVSLHTAEVVSADTSRVFSLMKFPLQSWSVLMGITEPHAYVVYQSYIYADTKLLN